MFRVEECDSEEAIERKEYDTKFVNDFLHCIDAGEVEVARVTRIGVRSKNKDNKDRPIKAQELEVLPLNYPYSLKTKSSQCHYVMTL